MRDQDFLAADFKPQPYWWDHAPPTLPDSAGGVLPNRCDVAVIGSGYAGLHAAIVLARMGVDVVVIDAEALGINLFKYKMYAFGISSFYGGIAGSLLFTLSGGVEPGSFSLLYSITFVAIVIIGGVGTVLGPLFGAFFFTMLPGIIQALLHAFGVGDTGFIFNPAEIERIVFAFFIIFFLIFEPRGMWGIWFRLRNYFKAWPFSY